MLGTPTGGSKMECIDKSTEPWWHHDCQNFLINSFLHVGLDPGPEVVDICKDCKVAMVIIFTMVIPHHSNSIKIGNSIFNMKKGWARVFLLQSKTKTYVRENPRKNKTDISFKDLLQIDHQLTNRLVKM